MSPFVQLLKTTIIGAVAEDLSDDEIREMLLTILRDNSREMDTKAAAEYLGYSAPTLKLWRYKKIGPKYRKDGGGRIRYRLDWLNQYTENGESKPLAEQWGLVK